MSKSTWSVRLITKRCPKHSENGRNLSCWIILNLLTKTNKKYPSKIQTHSTCHNLHHQSRLVQGVNFPAGRGAKSNTSEKLWTWGMDFGLVWGLTNHMVIRRESSKELNILTLNKSMPLLSGLMPFRWEIFPN